MADVTEAACLLESGMLYGTRALLRPAEGDPIFAGFKAGVFSLYVGDAPIFHFDREGRWQKVFHSGKHFLKGLSTSVQAVERTRVGTSLTLTRRTLGYAEASDLDAFVRSTVLDLIADLDAGRFEHLDPPPVARPLAAEPLRAFLESAARWDASAWFAQRERFLETYGPLPMLPPDAPAPLVVQATLGDASGRTFGGGPAAEFYARDPQEFDEHVRAVARLYGRRVEQCRQVVMAGADALRRPVDTVAAYLDSVTRALPIEPGHALQRPETGDDARTRIEGVHAVLDRFEGPLPGPGDWGRLRGLGLTRVSLGVESGDPDVRSEYGKTWTDADLRRVAAHLRAAGIGIGVLLLVGAGGKDHDHDKHASATADLVLSLDLGEGDLVALIDAADVEPAEGDSVLAGPARSARTADLRGRLAPLRARKVRLAPVSLERQGVF